MKYNFAQIKDHFLSKGATPLFTEYIDYKQKLRFICSKCKKNEHYTTVTQLFFKNRNGQLLCKQCLGNKQERYSEIVDAMSKVGAKPLFEKLGGVEELLPYKCSKCGNTAYFRLKNFVRGKVVLFQCEECRKSKKEIKPLFIPRYNISIVRDMFKEKGFTLLSIEYKNQYQELNFDCLKCSELTSIKLVDFVKGVNNQGWCKLCRDKEMFLNPLNLLKEEMNKKRGYSFMVWRLFSKINKRIR
jgi:hypothetical protein